jgi:hypothetical protein
MEEVGRLRSRFLGRAFLVSWILATPVFCLFTGLIWAAILGAITGGAIAKGWVSTKTDEFIAAACKNSGVAPEALDRKKYIIE